MKEFFATTTFEQLSDRFDEANLMGQFFKSWSNRQRPITNVRPWGANSAHRLFLGEKIITAINQPFGNSQWARVFCAIDKRRSAESISPEARSSAHHANISLLSWALSRLIHLYEAVVESCPVSFMSRNVSC